jgi:hypothetical protein
MVIRTWRAKTSSRMIRLEAGRSRCAAAIFPAFAHSLSTIDNFRYRNDLLFAVLAHLHSSCPRLHLKQNRNILANNCARVCNIRRFNIRKPLNIKAICMALELHSQEAQVRRDCASRGDQLQSASWGTTLPLGCRRRFYRSCPCDAGEWLVVTVTVDGYGSVPESGEFALKVHGRRPLPNVAQRAKL